jgi:uncharacterized protein (TIRG00374 family)
MNTKSWLSLSIRIAITVLAFLWIAHQVDWVTLKQAFLQADPYGLGIGVALFLLAQCLCIVRWRILIPSHPAVTWAFLTRSFFVASFFNTILPTTVGGDVVRGYDLIRATGQWRTALASVLMDRLVGWVGFLSVAIIAWCTFKPVREDTTLQLAFWGFCLLTASALAVLGSRKVFHFMLRPFARVGLGALESHARQFQESVLNYVKQPKILLHALGVTLGVQLCVIFMFASVSQAFHLTVPIPFFMLIVPVVITLSQLPISLNGWGIREAATIMFLGQVGVSGEKALALSLLVATIPVISAVVGAVLFLKRKRQKKR